MDVYIAVSQKDCEGVGSIVFASEATNAGQPVGVDVNFDNIGFYAEVKSLEKTAEKVTLTISAASHGLQFNRKLTPEAVSYTHLSASQCRPCCAARRAPIPEPAFPSGKPCRKWRHRSAGSDGQGWIFRSQSPR